MSVAFSKIDSHRQSDMPKLLEAYKTAREALLSEQTTDGYWLGELSSSALSTATAASALSIVSLQRFSHLIAPAVEWLEANQNSDGGWGDTPTSPSNTPTTMLVQGAFYLSADGPDRGSASQLVKSDCLRKAECYLREKAGASAEERAQHLRSLYGADRTFAVPILTNCALASSMPEELRVAWTEIPGLPFELACFPMAWFRWLRLHVVSYALPALIAIGQLIHTRHPTRNPLLLLIRNLAISPSLRRLEAIRPESGGFLEAVPLTSFVVMSLAAAGRTDHLVTRKGVEFIENTARSDGSWPIDSNLSNWLTTLAVSALMAGDHPCGANPDATRRWLLESQYKTRHPYTDSPPGGWGWTHLSGGTPDADDTAGALLALALLGTDETFRAAADGLNWLLNLQNDDGGWPTFCRGWGKLPFDRSAPDLTAHALRAIEAWRGVVDGRRARSAIARGFGYLRRTQRPDGSWVPLWFGNQRALEQQNPVYGTSRVLAAYRDLSSSRNRVFLRNSLSSTPQHGVDYLVHAQNADGGWGGDMGILSSIEETALAVEAIGGWHDDPRVREACLRGCHYLAERVAEGRLNNPAPIGLYFARLWYSEKLYPIIWTVAALGRALPYVQRMESDS